LNVFIVFLVLAWSGIVIAPFLVYTFWIVLMVLAWSLQSNFSEKFYASFINDLMKKFKFRLNQNGVPT